MTTPATVAIVGDPRSERARDAWSALDASPATPTVIGATATAPFSLAYRSARLGLVTQLGAAPAAIAVHRLARVPWIAVVSRRQLDNPLNRVLTAQAAAVAAPSGELALIRERLPHARLVPLDDPKRLAAAVEDIALGEVRATRRSGGTLVAAWVFANDRATRLAVRLTVLTGKAPRPTHPKHLIAVPWHYWYLDSLQPDDRVLDVGCGSGEHLFAAARVVRFATGVEVDAGQVQHARDRAHAERVANVEIANGDLTSDSTLARFGKATFDAVLALDVLEHLVDRGLLLERIHELLAPRGRLIVAVPNRDTPYKRWRRRLGGFAYSDPDHKVEYDEPSARAELEQHGFEIRDVQRGGFDTPFAGWSALVGAFSLGAYRRMAARRERVLRAHPEHASAFRIVAVRRP